MASEAKEVGRISVRCLLLVGGAFLRRFSKNSRKSVLEVSEELPDVA